MMRSTFFIFILMSIFLTPFSSHALKFSNQFVEFELPSQWKCSLESAEWVCQNTNDTKKRDAIIVLAAKLKGDQDSLEKYQEYLAKPRLFTTPNGKSVSSEPKYAKVAPINSQDWVDSIHLQSEIPDFYTRYLATVKQDIAVLVTYSINKAKYQEYLTQFEEMVKSLKVFRKTGGINTNVNANLFNQAQLPGSFTAGQVFPDNLTADGKKKAKKKSEDGDSSLLLIVLLIGVGGFILYKRKKKNR